MAMRISYLSGLRLLAPIELHFKRTIAIQYFGFLSPLLEAYSQGLNHQLRKDSYAKEV
jgi:hypothetical protein